MSYKTLFLGLLLSISSFIFAQQDRNLVLISGVNEAFSVRVNGKQINNYPLKDIRITGLSDNYYNIDIVFDHQYNKFSKKIYVPPFSEIVYEVYPPDSRNSNGIFIIKDIYPLDNHIPYYAQNLVFPWQNSGQTNNANNNQNNTQINININNQNSGTPDGAVYVPGYQGQIGCQPPVTPERFENMLHTIENQDFESSKLSTAKQIVKYNNCLTVNQLVQILNLFDFDDTKLKLAKFAYDYIYDIEDFYKVNNVFDFDSNKKKLAKYLENRD